VVVGVRKNLSLIHDKGARTGAASATGQSPGTGDGVSGDRARQGQGIAGRRSGLYGHAELARDLAAEISAQRKGTAFGLAGNKAGRVRGELEIADVERAVTIDSERRSKTENGSVVDVEQGRVPRSIDISVGIRIGTTACQDKTHCQQHGYSELLHRVGFLVVSKFGSGRTQRKPARRALGLRARLLWLETLYGWNCCLEDVSR